MPHRRASRRRGPGTPRRRRRARRAGAASGRAPRRPSRASTARSGPRRVADEERVAGQHEPGSSPRVRSTTAKAQCSGRCPGVWIVAHDDRADLDLRAVLERVVRDTPRSAAAWIEHRHAVLEREPAVTRDVVGVRVRLEHARRAAPRRARPPPGTARSRRPGRRRRDSGLLVADEVRRAAEIVVDELLEQHAATLATFAAISPEVRRPGRRTARRRPADRGGVRRSAASVRFATPIFLEMFVRWNFTVRSAASALVGRSARWSRPSATRRRMLS